MSDLISRQDVLKLVDKGCLISNGNYQKVRKMVETLPSAEPERCEDCGNFNKTMLLIPQPKQKRGEWTTEEVAEILARVLGDECACNCNGIDEWLPSACKYADTECPTPKEKHGCWIQFLMQGGADVIEKGEDMQYTEFQKVAIKAVVDYFNSQADSTDKNGKLMSDQVYIVWMARALQNWKCLLSTCIPDGMYYEFTWNGDKNEGYLDAYKKWKNVVVKRL